MYIFTGTISGEIQWPKLRIKIKSYIFVRIFSIITCTNKQKQWMSGPMTGKHYYLGLTPKGFIMCPFHTTFSHSKWVPPSSWLTILPENPWWGESWTHMNWMGSTSDLSMHWKSLELEANFHRRNRLNELIKSWNQYNRKKENNIMNQWRVSS